MPDCFRSYKCGAVLVQPGWAMTAAHCIASGSTASDYQVRLATVHQEGDADASLQTIQVQQLFTHSVSLIIIHSWRYTGVYNLVKICDFKRNLFTCLYSDKSISFRSLNSIKYELW